MGNKQAKQAKVHTKDLAKKDTQEATKTKPCTSASAEDGKEVSDEHEMPPEIQADKGIKMDSLRNDDELSKEELEANARAEERYFATKKAGPKPTVAAADQEELVTFVEDGLNRGTKPKPKPALGSNRRPANKSLSAVKKKPSLISRNLCTLTSQTPLPSPAMASVFDSSILVTEILVFAGPLVALPALASVSTATCLASRTPNWRRLAEVLAWDHGFLAVDLQLEHPAAAARVAAAAVVGGGGGGGGGGGDQGLLSKSVEEAWKARYWALFQARHLKWGITPPTTKPTTTMRGGGSKSSLSKAKPKSYSAAGAGGGGGGGGTATPKRKSTAFKMQVMVRFRPSVSKRGVGHEEDEEEDEEMFLPLHQRLQLERMGHDTSLEQEVHKRMTSTTTTARSKNGGPAKTFEKQKLGRDNNSGAKETKDSKEVEKKQKKVTGKKSSLSAQAIAEAKKEEGGAEEKACKGEEKDGDDDDDDDDDDGAVEARPRQTFRAKIVNAEEKRVLVNLPGAGLRYFDFDAVMDGTRAAATTPTPPSGGKELTTQETTYVTAAVPAMDAFLNGFSACIFVYGQTGSGKTHTMFGGDGALEAIASQYGATTSSNSSSSTEQGVGDDNGASRSSATSAPLSPSASSAAVFEAHGPLHREVGIVPRVLVDLMGVLDLMKGSVDATVLVNYVEIYNDQVSDLISGAPVTLYRVGSGAGADRFQDTLTGSGGGEGGGKELFQLSGASDVQVSSVGGILQALVKGEKNKHKAATAMNERSSRAHTVFMVQLTQRHKGNVKRSRLHLVDLGGSEQVKRSKAEGGTLNEAIEINTSLMVLGQVIDALVQRKSHVPYYESKLTMLLQPALGGNARTTVLVTASPDRADADETLHALRFGERCRQVENKAVSSTVSMAEVLAALDKSITQCEASLKSLESAGGKAKAEAEKKVQASRTGGAAAAFVQTKAGSGAAEEGNGGGGGGGARKEGGYTMVEDVAGKYLAEKDRLDVLRRRKKEIIGGGGSEGH